MDGLGWHYAKSKKWDRERHIQIRYHLHVESKNIREIPWWSCGQVSEISLPGPGFDP